MRVLTAFVPTALASMLAFCSSEPVTPGIPVEEPPPAQSPLPGSPAQRAATEILEYGAAGGTLLPGESAVSSLRLRNGGASERTFWVGYSVQDPAGRWSDVPSHGVRLGAGESSPPQPKSWSVPADAAPGFYRVAMAVWDAPPEGEGATRLAELEPGEFRVDSRRDPANRLDAEGWRRAGHALGRGRFRPENVRGDGGQVRLRLPAGAYDGAEIRSYGRYLHGRYEARLRAPDAPGSLTAFFLYEDVPERNGEIDVEILNDGSRVAVLAVWVDGEQALEARVTLPFDPAAAAHVYALDFRPGELVFLADGAPLHRWRGALPTRPMRVMASAWWPTWLSGAPLAEDRWAAVEWIRY